MIIISSRNDSFSNILGIVLLVSMIYAVYLNIFSFEFMPQARTLLDSNKSLFFWFEQGHFHAIRLLITYPAYLASIFFETDLNLAYGYYCSIVFALLYNFLVGIKNKYIYSQDNAYTNCIFILLIYILAIIMNGRICFAFLGFSMVISEMTSMYLEERPKHWVNRYINVAIGVIFSTVSVEQGL